MGKKSATSSISQQVLDALIQKYPVSATMLEFGNPWELLVATILSAQCTDARVNSVTPGFFSRWPGPAELAEAPLEQIEQAIFQCGFYHNKARNLQACAKMIVDEYGGKVPDSLEKLIRLPGVARKTANVVLFAAFGINSGIAVDTHVKRISQRLGLADSADPKKIEKQLMKLFPQEEWGNINLRLVAFGREICKARKPLCADCQFASFCLAFSADA